MNDNLIQDNAPTIYNSDFVEQLFDEMSDTYTRMNEITSFGFSSRWRRQFVDDAKIHSGMIVCDLMCGMGECWQAVAPKIGGKGRIIGIDFSQGMLRGAIKQRNHLAGVAIEIVRLNVLEATLESESVDVVLSGFGLKTFSAEQVVQLAAEIKRILKPGGRFSLVEVSVPAGWWLKGLYMFYLKQIIPILGWLFLGNPENYRMLGIYTEQFQNCQQVAEIFQQQGLHTKFQRYFFGCASGIYGVKE